jgi:hypothetical protein
MKDMAVQVAGCNRFGRMTTDRGLPQRIVARSPAVRRLPENLRCVWVPGREETALWGIRGREDLKAAARGAVVEIAGCTKVV